MVSLGTPVNYKMSNKSSSKLFLRRMVKEDDASMVLRGTLGRDVMDEVRYVSGGGGRGGRGGSVLRGRRPCWCGVVWRGSVALTSQQRASDLCALPPIPSLPPSSRAVLHSIPILALLYVLFPALSCL